MKDNIIEEKYEPKQEGNEDKYNTFNRLKTIQKLLKKESALKELCKFKEIIKYIYSHSN